MPHFGHDPPQSTSLSVPFLVESAHVAAWQVPLPHTRLAQSEGPPHPCPAPHAGHVAPPQSTSLSDPFLVWSEHEAT